MDTKATVCVIGAGVAGLVTAKTLAQDGFDRDRELLPRSQFDSASGRSIEVPQRASLTVLVERFNDDWHYLKTTGGLNFLRPLRSR